MHTQTHVHTRVHMQLRGGLTHPPCRSLVRALQQQLWLCLRQFRAASDEQMLQGRRDMGVQPTHKTPVARVVLRAHAGTTNRRTTKSRPTTGCQRRSALD